MSTLPRLGGRPRQHIVTEIALAGVPPATLLTFPNRGRLGKKEGTRELVMSPLPYVVIYSLHWDAVYVVRILHGAQQWP